MDYEPTGFLPKSERIVVEGAKVYTALKASFFIFGIINRIGETVGWDNLTDRYKTAIVILYIAAGHCLGFGLAKAGKVLTHNSKEI